MSTLTINSKIITKEVLEDGKLIMIKEIYPIIPFDEFPKGPRSLGLDINGYLVWTIIVED